MTATERQPFYDPRKPDYTICFECGNDTFEIAGPTNRGKILLACKKCGRTLRKDRRDIIIFSDEVKLKETLPNFPPISDHRGYLPRVRK